MIDDDGEVGGGAAAERRREIGVEQRASESEDEQAEHGHAGEEQEPVLDVAAALLLERRFDEELHRAPADGGGFLAVQEVDDHGDGDRAEACEHGEHQEHRLIELVRCLRWTRLEAVSFTYPVTSPAAEPLGCRWVLRRTDAAQFLRSSTCPIDSWLPATSTAFALIFASAGASI